MPSEISPFDAPLESAFLSTRARPETSTNSASAVSPSRTIGVPKVYDTGVNLPMIALARGIRQELKDRQLADGISV